MNCKKCGFLMNEDARECPFCHFSVQDLSKESKVTLTNDATETAKAAAITNVKEQAFYYMESVKVAMEALRTPVDKLEMLVDSSVWPMPTYADLMFEV